MGDSKKLILWLSPMLIKISLFGLAAKKWTDFSGKAIICISPFIERLATSQTFIGKEVAPSGWAVIMARLLSQSKELTGKSVFIAFICLN